MDRSPQTAPVAMSRLAVEHSERCIARHLSRDTSDQVMCPQITHHCNHGYLGFVVYKAERLPGRQIFVFLMSCMTHCRCPAEHAAILTSNAAS